MVVFDSWKFREILKSIVDKKEFNGDRTIVDSKSQGEVPYISELDIACFSAIDNSR